MAEDFEDDDDWEEEEDGDDWDDDEGEPKKKKAAKPRKQKEQITVGRGILKLSLIVGGSAVVSVLITAVAAFAVTELPELRRALGIRQSGYNNMLFIVFLLSFLFTVGTSAFAFLSNADLSFKPKNTAGNQAARFIATEQKAWKQTMATTSADRERQQRARDAAKRAREMEDELEAIDGDDLDDSEVEKEVSNTKLTAKGEQQKAAVMTFLSKGLETVMTTRPKLDAFNKFGVNLFLAGACDAAGASSGLEDGETAQILQEGVEVLGTSRDQAQKFARSYDSYLLNPKHLGMIEAGRDAMSDHLRGGAGAPQKLDSALKGWNTKDEDEQTSKGTIAVMFTDIAGSTAMTQEHGDAGAQEVVRMHNRIVRAALTTYKGREVKHTGDGIMASFNNTAQSVEAAIYIQQKVAQENPSQRIPLGIKIGINAGEPIVEDDDLFGTTVQLSARIVDKAGTGEIFVSEVVKSICTGKPITFVSRGGREMKGFDEPVMMYEAVWDSSKTNAQAAKAAPPPPPATPRPAAAPA